MSDVEKSSQPYTKDQELEIVEALDKIHCDTKHKDDLGSASYVVMSFQTRTDGIAASMAVFGREDLKPLMGKSIIDAAREMKGITPAAVASFLAAKDGQEKLHKYCETADFVCTGAEEYLSEQEQK